MTVFNMNYMSPDTQAVSSGSSPAQDGQCACFGTTQYGHTQAGGVGPEPYLPDGGVRGRVTSWHRNSVVSAREGGDRRNTMYFLHAAGEPVAATSGPRIANDPATSLSGEPDGMRRDGGYESRRRWWRMVVGMATALVGLIVVSSSNQHFLAANRKTLDGTASGLGQAQSIGVSVDVRTNYYDDSLEVVAQTGEARLSTSDQDIPNGALELLADGAMTPSGTSVSLVATGDRERYRVCVCPARRRRMVRPCEGSVSATPLSRVEVAGLQLSLDTCDLAKSEPGSIASPRGKEAHAMSHAHREFKVSVNVSRFGGWGSASAKYSQNLGK
jgi:hypothetical protein